ncbi:hypothetical protein BCEP4_520011 [Burkholderia cepacia]|nr:hypothetical protein BCEP4_520011 [Burkholderia cepacia]
MTPVKAARKQAYTSVPIGEPGQNAHNFGRHRSFGLPRFPCPASGPPPASRRRYPSG